MQEKPVFLFGKQQRATWAPYLAPQKGDLDTVLEVSSNDEFWRAYSGIDKSIVSLAGIDSLASQLQHRPSQYSTALFNMPTKRARTGADAFTLQSNGGDQF